MSRFYSSVYFDNEVNLKTATIREAVTVSDVPLTANVIATVSNTQALIETINTTSAADPALGIRYDTLVANSGQPDIANIAYSSLVPNSGQPNVALIIDNALALYSNANPNRNNQVIVGALEASNVSTDDLLVGNVDATTIEAGNVIVDYIHAGDINSNNVITHILSGQVIVLEPYMMCTVPTGLALCHRSNNAPVQTEAVVQGYRVIAMFCDDP